MSQPGIQKSISWNWYNWQLVSRNESAWYPEKRQLMHFWIPSWLIPGYHKMLTFPSDYGIQDPDDWTMVNLSATRRDGRPLYRYLKQLEVFYESNGNLWYKQKLFSNEINFIFNGNFLFPMGFFYFQQDFFKFWMGVNPYWSNNLKIIQ